MVQDGLLLAVGSPVATDGLEVVRVVVAPVIDARAQGDDQLRHRREDVLDEHALALLGAAGDALS